MSTNSAYIHFKINGPVEFCQGNDIYLLLGSTAYNYALQNIYLYLCIATRLCNLDAQMMMRNRSNIARLSESKFDYIYVL